MHQSVNECNSFVDSYQRFGLIYTTAISVYCLSEKGRSDTCEPIVDFIKLFLNQAHALVSWNCFGSCISMCVCVSALEAINNQWHDMVWYRPCTIG